MFVCCIKKLNMAGSTTSTAAVSTSNAASAASTSTAGASGDGSSASASFSTAGASGSDSAASASIPESTSSFTQSGASTPIDMIDLCLETEDSPKKGRPLLPSNPPRRRRTPLVQALRNDLNKGLNVEDGKFDWIFGEGSRKEVAQMIRAHFNMDGRDPSGRKVGLLDRKDLMCFLVDPFSWEWRSTFFWIPTWLSLCRR